MKKNMKLFKSYSEKEVKKVRPIVDKINNLEELKSYRYNLEEKVRILKGKRENLWRKRSNNAKEYRIYENLDEIVKIIDQAY